MVHLCKLQLRGIRSYNPNTLNTIEFYSPLTLIVGVNGSGKTTIIETLKYITCNELPQNTRGGAFIYDPKLLGTHDVKANIKLSFVNIDNKEMTIQRSLQGIQKKTGLTQKSLETNLSVIDNDQIINVSNKLSAVDVQMEHFLGVSNALLQNIIFCHQEESNWFLSEPVNVKKKFDDIFNTTKYSKALDNIKSVRRELGSKVKMKMQELEYLMERKMKKEKVKVTSYEQKQKMEMIGFELDKLGSMNYENEIVKIRNEIDKEKGNENEYNRLQLEIGMMERICSESISKDVFLENVISIKKIEDCHKNIFMGADLSFLGLNDSTIEYNIDWATMYANDSDFKTKLGLFEKHILDYNKSVDFYHNRSVEIRDKLRNLEQKQKDTMKSYDKIDKCKNEILIAKNEICKILQTTEYDNTIDHIALLNDNDDLHSFKELILCLENELQRESKEIIMLECEIKETKNKQRNNEQELHELEKSLESYKKQLEVITQGNDNFLDIDENEHDLVIEKESLCKKIAELEESYYIAIKNNEKNYEQKHLKQQKEICKAKMCDLIQDIRININAIQEHVKTNQKLRLLLSKMADSITFCDNDECEYDDVINMWHDTKNVLFDKINTEIAEFEERKIIRDDLITKLSDIQNHADLQIIKDIHDPRFNSASSEDYANKLEEKSNTLSMSQNAIVLFDNFQKKGLQRNMCYLCHRKFTSDEKDAYRSNISNILSNLKIKANTCKIEHDQYMQYKNDFENRRMINAKVEDIRILIEKFYGDQDTNKCMKLKIEDFILQIKNEDCDDLYEAQNKLHTIEPKITRLHDCINEYRNLEPIYDFEYIDIEDIKIDITKTKGELEAVENKIVRIRRNLDYKSSIQNKDNICNEIEKLNKCIDKARMQDRKFLDVIASANKRVKAVTEKVSTKNQDLQRFRQELGKARLSIDEKIRKINNSTYIIDQNEAWISQEMSLIYRADASCKENTNYQQCLDSIKRSIERDVTKTRKEYDECNSNLQTVKSELEMAQKELTKYEKCLETIEKYMLNLDNCSKLEVLRQKLQSIDYEYIDGLKNDLQKLEKLNNESNNRIFMLIGEQKQIEIQYKRIEAELSNDYCDAEDKYSECYIEVKTLEYIIEDVEKCIKALDKSIVEFYSTKIDEINAILKDLWVNTYKGNDIDYIMLKSETNDNKVYNYRMVMCKNGIELDLRGRSSAGQKMLISILTRLAICDAFCSTFNVLALDEPTTNLDRENIESLAYMLQKIIDSRKLSNFQLIIITHDESFLETMNRNGCNEYYRVYKDTFGNSMITKENLYQ